MDKTGEENVVGIQYDAIRVRSEIPDVKEGGYVAEEIRKIAYVLLETYGLPSDSALSIRFHRTDRGVEAVVSLRKSQP